MAEAFTATYDEQDYLNASALHWRRSMLGLKFIRKLAIIAVLAAVVYGAIAGTSGSSPTETAVVMLISAPGAAALIVLIALIHRLIGLPRIVRRNFRQMKEYHQPWSFEVGDEKLNINNSRGSAMLPYGDFVKWAEDEKVFLVYRSERLFNLIPRRAMPANQREALLARLAMAGSPKAGFWNS